MITELDLDRMSLEELQRTRHDLERAIQARGREGRLGAWVVECWPAPARCFKETDFLAAAEALLEVARDMEAAGVKPHRRDLRLTYRLLPESEYHRLVGVA